jgi:hypothetical protein
MNWSESLRREISQQARDYAERYSIPCYFSVGQVPTVMFEAYAGGTLHGNFLPFSYKAILGKESWKKRLNKPHQQNKAFPIEKRTQAKELDSSNSSDALLMNVFCNPKVLKISAVAKWFELDSLPEPEFGFPGEVPFGNGKKDTTEIDMRLSSVFVEAKVTETDFTGKAKSHVESYRDFKTVFEISALPQTEKEYLNYQLIRNVLAAFAHKTRFVLICDARRPDLLRSWWDVLKCVKSTDLRLQCKFVLWQEIATCVGRDLKVFLEDKYGIVAK